MGPETLDRGAQAQTVSAELDSLFCMPDNPNTDAQAYLLGEELEAVVVVVVAAIVGVDKDKGPPIDMQNLGVSHLSTQGRAIETGMRATRGPKSRGTRSTSNRRPPELPPPDEHPWCHPSSG